MLWRVWESVTEKNKKLAEAGWCRWAWRFFTVLAVIAAWVPFRAATVTQAVLMLRSMLLKPSFAVSYSVNSFLIVLVFAGYCFAEPFLTKCIANLDAYVLKANWSVNVNWFVLRPAAYAVLLFLFLLFDDRNTQFIYFQF